MKQFKYQQLANLIKKKLADEHWQPHTKLPSIRALAKTYQLSIISVQKSLQLLETWGNIYVKHKSGYYVSPEKKPMKQPQQQPLPKPKLVDVPDVFHEIMEHSAAFDIAPQSVNNNQTPNHLLILNRHISRAFRQFPQNKALYYSKPAGSNELRLQISRHYTNRNLHISAQDICITSGCQNSLFLALMASCQAGDIVAVESPAFYGVLQLLQLLKLKVIELPCSYTQGLRAKTLKEAAKKWPIKACILTPSFATPTGALIPTEEQKKIIQIANDHEIILIEDDIYGDLGFHSRVSPLKQFDNQGRVILCSSFSKSLSRDLRVGWIITSKNFDKIAHIKLVNQLSTSQAIQQGLTTFLAEGHYERHLNQYRKTLLMQRELLTNALSQYWRFPIRYTIPEGGLALWLELPQQVDTLSLYNKARQQGITLTPGQLFSSNKGFHKNLRLSFAHPITGHRLNALIQLGEIISKAMTNN
ncbi:PLP-dependent aminotransferase family protein [Thalassotalea sp. G2M2-11]|uniref:aminotransferase-like domain-containing protein n=1 Tax=Thalassotalea sp. G2M2-11 TaxID=2787627 RepID=UPI0019D138AB|nr:PLP-dependent aminotransferase family protein [Thalassotalea sp. G2M2-11]